MAVYERSWRRWLGDTTPISGRWLIVTRYALQDAFASRLFTAFYALCFLPTVAALVLVYLSHNLGPLAAIGVRPEDMDAFAMGYVRMLFILQAVPAFFLAVIVVPPLISADLTHGALPLYLARPLNRWSYLGGKALVPALLLSPPTWIAGMGVFGVKAILAGGTWWIDNLRLASGFLIGHTVWIAVVTLVTLAISTFVRYAWAARGALFALFFVLGGFSAAVNLVTRSRWGSLMSIVYDIRTVVADLFGVRPPDSLPPVACWLALAAAASLSLAILAQTLRAHQEVT